MMNDISPSPSPGLQSLVSHLEVPRTHSFAATSSKGSAESHGLTETVRHVDLGVDDLQ